MFTSTKNIWGAFYTLVVGLVLFATVISYLIWDGLLEAKQSQQRYAAQLVSSSTHQLFRSIETLLDNVGKELLNTNNRTQAQAHINHVLSLNPAFVGLGLADTQGNLTLVSNNLDPTKLPNLLELEDTQQSFRQALISNRMSVGRTYLMPALGEWLIPVRKAIKDSSGNLLAVMTAGVRLDGPKGIFPNPLHTDANNSVLLFRPTDNYIQYLSSEPAHAPSKIYGQPVDKAIIAQAIGYMEDYTQSSIEALSRKRGVYNIRFTSALSPTFKDRLGSLSFDPDYHIWTVSHSPWGEIYWIAFNRIGLVFGTLLIIVLAFYTLVKRIIVTETQRKESLLHQTQHDALTGLANRTHLNNYMRELLTKSNEPFAVIYIDLDHFKSANDSHGHDFGDEVLITVSTRLKQLIDEDGLVVRQSGDEFIVLVHECHRASLSVLASNIIQQISAPYGIRNTQFILGCSIGIAHFPDHGEDPDAIMRAADIAMYEAKKSRNSFFIYTKAIEDQYLSKLTIEQRLKQSLGSRDFFMVYQPKTDAQGKMVGVEALVRWNDSELGFVPPDQFIAIAESTGLMHTLGQHIFAMTFADIKGLEAVAKQHQLDCLNLAINVSIAQFIAPGFYTLVESHLANLNSNIVNITLEVTEGLFIENIAYVQPLLSKLKALNVSISMDDFGTGYSSLSMLKTLPFDELKIDRSFIEQILTDQVSRQMLQHIVSLGECLNMRIVAEGVETKEQHELLKSYGCKGFQGYYFSPPLALERLSAHTPHIEG